MQNKVLRIAVLNNKWVELKLIWYTYLDRYFDSSWRLKEILANYRDNTVWIYFTFEKEVRLREPRTVMGIDINFNNITYTIVDLQGNLVSMGVIPFNGLKRALTHRIIAEKIQRKYSRRWRYVKGVGKAVRRHGRRTRNILIDSCHYISGRIVKIAREYNALMVLVNLNKLRSRANSSRKYNRKLSLWTYRRIQTYTHYKALIDGLPIVFVSPKNTSKTSPLGDELVFINYKWVKLPNGHIVTRDMVASWNLALRGLNLLTRDVGLPGFVEALKALDGDETPNPMRGKPVHYLLVTMVFGELARATTKAINPIYP